MLLQFSCMSCNFLVRLAHILQDGFTWDISNDTEIVDVGKKLLHIQYLHAHMHTKMHACTHTRTYTVMGKHTQHTHVCT